MDGNFIIIYTEINNLTNKFIFIWGVRKKRRIIYSGLAFFHKRVNERTSFLALLYEEYIYFEHAHIY